MSEVIRPPDRTQGRTFALLGRHSTAGCRPRCLPVLACAATAAGAARCPLPQPTPPANVRSQEEGDTGAGCAPSCPSLKFLFGGELLCCEVGLGRLKEAPPTLSSLRSCVYCPPATGRLRCHCNDAVTALTPLPCSSCPRSSIFAASSVFCCSRSRRARSSRPKVGACLGQFAVAAPHRASLELTRPPCPLHCSPQRPQRAHRVRRCLAGLHLGARQLGDWHGGVVYGHGATGAGAGARGWLLPANRGAAQRGGAVPGRGSCSCPTLPPIVRACRFRGLFWKFARVGERLSPWVGAACIFMAFSVMFF